MQNKRPIYLSLTALAIAGCSLLGTSAADAATTEPRPVTQPVASQPPKVQGAIYTKWVQSGSAKGILGEPTSPEIVIKGGVYQTFKNGVVYWSASTGAHIVIGAVRVAYDVQKDASGDLGFPTSDAYLSQKVITVQNFQSGVITFDAKAPVTGGTLVAHAVIGDFAKELAAAGGVDVLGAARDNAVSVNGGRIQNFNGGGTILASASTGAHVMNNARITKEWLETGQQSGVLGFPTSSPKTLFNGVTYQTFTGGVITVSGADEHAYAVTGVAYQRFISPSNDFSTSPNGSLGLMGAPLSDQINVPGGFNQVFKNGVLVSQKATGTYFVPGDMFEQWAGNGYQSGALGFPVSEAQRVSSTVTTQTFEHGIMVRSTVTGTHFISGDVAKKFVAEGGVSLFGAPTENTEHAGQGAFVQTFEKGVIGSSPTTGTHVILDKRILGLWNASPNRGNLQYPTTDIYSTPDGGVAQRFHSGYIGISAKGVVTIISGNGVVPTPVSTKPSPVPAPPAKPVSVK